MFLVDCYAFFNPRSQKWCYLVTNQTCSQDHHIIKLAWEEIHQIDKARRGIEHADDNGIGHQKTNVDEHHIEKADV